MKRRYLSWLFAALLFSAILSDKEASASAVDLTVEHNPNGVAHHFATIQQALDFVTQQRNNPINSDTFRILVRADAQRPYPGAVKALDGVPIIGDSTAETLLTSNSSDPVISLNGVKDVTISNFTFINGTTNQATTGITVSNSTGTNTIQNCVFTMGTNSTAIQVQNAPISPNTLVINNTFYNNGTAISTLSNLTVSNDIFANNTTAISTQSAISLSYCDFFNNGGGVPTLDNTSIPSSKVPNSNPLFVNALDRDFHLKSGSPAIGSGNPSYHNPNSSSSDMGAFGGPDADTTPPTVTGVSSSLLEDGRAQVSWAPTSDTTVTNYRAYYGTAPGSTTPYPNSVLVPVGTTTAKIDTSQISAPPAPGAATLVSVTPLNKGLRVRWSAVAGASGYHIYYSTTEFDATTLPANPKDVDGGSTTTADLTGLTNGLPYFVAVAAFAQAKVYAAVTAVVDSSLPASQGTANESAFSDETSVGVSDAVPGAVSAVKPDNRPEATAPVPNLKGGGCFIATAAFGFYSAPQVQVLRDFRDRYLVTNAPGRAFVAWYYRYGPIGARYLNAHPWLKAPVRIALLPLIGMSLFLLYVPFPVKLVMLLLIPVGAWSRDHLKKKIFVGEAW